MLQHGWNTTCYQILNPGIDLWFSGQGDAVVGYVRRYGVHVVAGAPVCSKERLPSVIEEWSGFAKQTCYFGAEERLHRLLSDQKEYSTVVLGAQPVWSPRSFSLSARSDRSLRQQLNRALNKGVTVEEWPSEQAVSNPELRRILDEWLETRRFPTMHFLVEPNTLDRLMDRRLFVGLREGKPVSFVVLAPSMNQQTWLTEQFVRGREAPNGAIELTLAYAVDAIEAASMVTMGIVPLSQNVDYGAASPLWLRAVLAWTRAHGKRFYNFDGLDAFKSKFRPDRWDAIYAISRESQFSPRTLHAVTAAFTSTAPVWAVSKALGRAVREELGL